MTSGQDGEQIDRIIMKARMQEFSVAGVVCVYSSSERRFMAALRSRSGHYIFVTFLSSSSFFFPSPNLGGRRLDVYRTSTHGVALVRI